MTHGDVCDDSRTAAGPPSLPVRRALIPCAGRGTRMAPFSLVVPKELVPLGATPALQFVLEEAARGGIEQVGLIVRPGKGRQLEEFVEQLLAASDLCSGLDVQRIEQPEPLGLGDAITCARDFVAGESFALMLPDNLLLSAHHRLADLIAVHQRDGREVLGVLELDHSRDREYGNCGRIGWKAEDGRVLDVDSLQAKEPGRLRIAPGEVVRRSCGRSICTADLIEEIERLRSETEGELDEVPAMRRLIEQRGAWGFVLEAPVFDVGYPLGCLAAASWLYERERTEASVRS